MNRNARVADMLLRFLRIKKQVAAEHSRIAQGRPNQILLGQAAKLNHEVRNRVIIACGVVVASAGVLLFVLWSDLDDDTEDRPGDCGAAVGASRAGTDPLGSTLAVPPAASIRRSPAVTPPTSSGPPPGTSPIGMEQAQPSVLPAEVRARAIARNGGNSGTALVAQARDVTPPSLPADRSKSGSADAGVVVALGHDEQSPPGQGPNEGLPLRRDGPGRRQRDDDGLIRVARFLKTGGVDFTGRVVDAGTGRPASGVSVEARLAGRFVEVESEADGTFIMSGMIPGSKVLVWIGGRRDRVVAERLDVRISDSGKTTDLGVVKLLPGDEQDSRLDGWIGIYVARRDDKIKVSAVNAWVPARSAGIEVGDTLLSVNGRDIKGLGPRNVAFLLRGLNGSSITLEVESGDGRRRQLTLKRVLR